MEQHSQVCHWEVPANIPSAPSAQSSKAVWLTVTTGHPCSFLSTTSTFSGVSPRCQGAQSCLHPTSLRCLGSHSWAVGWGQLYAPWCCSPGQHVRPVGPASSTCSTSSPVLVPHHNPCSAHTLGHVLALEQRVFFFASRFSPAYCFVGDGDVATMGCSNCSALPGPRSDEVVAVASMNYDPIVSKVAEVLAAGRTIRKRDVE